MIEDEKSLEVHLFLAAAYKGYGYDFSNYSIPSLKRRLERAVLKYQCADIEDLSRKILDDRGFFPQLLNDLTVTVTEMFRDPSVYKAIREEVLPYLKTYPEIKIWCAGCSGGEEVWSLAIMLMEEGLYDRSTIYGTDINPSALERAREGIVSLNSIKEGTKNYFAAAGKKSLNDYYYVNYDAAIFNSSLKKRVLFSDHNLVSDRPFGEMQLVLCRNVLIYFNRELQGRVLTVLKDSLCGGGFLCLGTKETLFLSEHSSAFDEFQKSERIYRRRL